MNRNLAMSINIHPSEICNGPSCGFATNRNIILAKLNTLAMANTPSDMRVGSSSGQSVLFILDGPYFSGLREHI